MVPANAHLDDSGNDWRCDRGFQAKDGSCVKIMIPLRAHLDSSGNAWMCDWGYELQAGQCMAEPRSNAVASID